MAGTAGRSGGDRHSAGLDTTAKDGGPVLPAGISKQAAAKWHELLPQLPGQALRKIDAHELRILCELLVLADTVSKAMETDPTDLKSARMLVTTAAQVHRFSASFGLNPQDRARLKIEPEPEQDEFAEMLRRRMLPRNVG